MNNKEISRTFLAMFGDPIRIQMLNIFKEKKEGITPSELGEILFPEIVKTNKAMVMSKVSSHLSVLAKSNILIRERKSKNNVYTLNPDFSHKDKLKIANYLIQIN